MNFCLVEGCGRPLHSGGLGLCRSHARRLQKHGDVQAHIPVTCNRPSRLVELTCCGCGRKFHREPNYVKKFGGRFCSLKCSNGSRRWTPEKFWSMVTKTDGCWIWNGSKQKSGHGCVQIASTKIASTAHRVAWVLTNGPVPKGMDVCHNCPGGDNPACVRPDHMFIGTRSDNVQDSIKKGTFRTGERHQNAKLTDNQIEEIRKLYDKGKFGIRKLGYRFGISHGYVSLIIRGHVRPAIQKKAA